MSLIDIVHAVDPTVLERARRLEVAMQLLKQGKTKREASGLLQQRFRITQPTAWRLVDAANDMVGKVQV